METKKWWSSKTLWVNGITLIVAIVAGVSGKTIDLSPEVMVSIIAGINIFLRFVTKSAVVIS